MSMQRKPASAQAGILALTGQPMPRWRAELPFGLLAASAIAAPFMVVGQGGDWHTAILAGLVVLGAPGAAVDAMIGAARVAQFLRDA
jgi:hypothetical protein